jgi:hypothetical protein
MKRSPIKRSATPIRKKRPGTRRGQPTPAEKKAIREFVFNRARGLCELSRWLNCCGGRYWRLDGEHVRDHGHLVHLRNKRVYGWGEDNLAWGCPHGHSDLMHTTGLQVPRTYSELSGSTEAVATGNRGAL